MKDQHLLNEIVQVADAKKADNVKILKIKEKSSVADYFVICSAGSAIQTRVIADEIEKQLKEKQNLEPTHREGFEKGRWILLDYGHIIVHIFTGEEREYYNLERYWGDAPRVELVDLDLVKE